MVLPLLGNSSATYLLLRNQDLLTGLSLGNALVYFGRAAGGTSPVSARLRAENAAAQPLFLVAELRSAAVAALLRDFETGNASKLLLLGLVAISVYGLYYLGNLQRARRQSMTPD